MSGIRTREEIWVIQGWGDNFSMLYSTMPNGFCSMYLYLLFKKISNTKNEIDITKI